MSTVEAQRRLLLERRAIEELARRIGREAYMSVKAVQKRLELSRYKVESIPVEVLPFVDLGLGTRHQKRYHPVDVLAVDARLRAWQAAQARSEGEAYLVGLREELEARDEVALQVAREMNEVVRVVA